MVLTADGHVDGFGEAPIQGKDDVGFPGPVVR